MINFVKCFTKISVYHISLHLIWKSKIQYIITSENIIPLDIRYHTINFSINSTRKAIIFILISNLFVFRNMCCIYINNNFQRMLITIFWWSFKVNDYCTCNAKYPSDSAYRWSTILVQKDIWHFPLPELAQDCIQVTPINLLHIGLTISALYRPPRQHLQRSIPRLLQHAGSEIYCSRRL